LLALRTILLPVGGVAVVGWGAVHLLAPTEIEFTRAPSEAPAQVELRPGLSTVHVALPVDLDRIATRMDDALAQRLAMGLDLNDPTCARKPPVGDCASTRPQATVASAGRATAGLEAGTVRIRLPLRIADPANADGASIATSISFAFTVRGGGAVPLEITRVNESSPSGAAPARNRLHQLVETRLKPLALTAEDELRAVLSALPITAAVQHAWGTLSQGIALEEATQTRLTAQPEVAGNGELATAADRTIYRIPIATRLALVTGAAETRTTRRPVVQGQVITAGRAAVRLAAPVPLTHLQPALDAAFVDAGPTQTQADRFGPPVTVEVSKVRLHPAAGSLALRMNISASRFAGQVYRGTAHLVGRPVLDADRQLLTLADIGFPQSQPSDPRRGTAPASTPRLATEPFASRLASTVRLDLSASLAETQPRASRLLNRRLDDRLVLSASLDEIRAIAFEVSSSGAWLVTEVGGALTMSYATETLTAGPAARQQPASTTSAQAPSVQPTAATATAAAAAAAVVTSTGLASSQALRALSEKSSAGSAMSVTAGAKPAPPETEAEAQAAAARRAALKRAASRSGNARQDAQRSTSSSASGKANWVPFSTNN
jgi:hypothetical protein